MDDLLSRLKQAGEKVIAGHVAGDYVEAILNEDIDVVLVDIDMEDMECIEILQKIKERHPPIEIIMLVNEDDPVEKFFRFNKFGPFNFIGKSAEPDEFLLKIGQARKRRLDQELRIKKEGLTFILEAMQDGVYVIDREYNLEFINRKIEADFGEMIGEKCYRMINRKDEPCPWCRAKEVFKGKTEQWEQYIPVTDKTYDMIALPMKNPDGTVSLMAICYDITEKKHSEEKLKILEEDYKRLFDNLEFGIYISSKEGKLLDANRVLLDMLGYELKEEFLKLDLTQELYLRPEERRRFQEIIERNGYVVGYEVEWKRKDGAVISVINTGQVRYDLQGNILGYEGIIVDQTKKKQMETDLRETNEFLRAIIESSPNAIIATDLKGNIRIWNHAAEEILGYKSEEVVRKMNIEKIYKGTDKDAKKMMTLLRSPDYGGKGVLKSYPMVIVKRDGKVIDINFSAAIINDIRGREVASVGIIVDLTDRLEMERKLRDTRDQLLQAEKLVAMGRLTSQIAHELNNPLYGIMNALELMKTEVRPENKRRRVLDMALSETVRLTELLRKILSFSNPNQEKKEPADVNILLEEILMLYEKQLRENSIKVSCIYKEGLPKIHASKNQLRQVILNMINNAKDAMPEGGSLKVSTRQNRDFINIDISDTGIGIKEEIIDKIFDPFFTTKDKVKDAGLGLSVSYGFIKEHGGDIIVESKWGSGTTFTISLPIIKG
ncbi:MAG: PAS domain S-box protein [Deltaproteobacteria bacterium]|nr:PAS domain S-box protein [Deltaproteobacteria bacterium]